MIYVLVLFVPPAHFNNAVIMLITVIGLMLVTIIVIRNVRTITSLLGYCYKLAAVVIATKYPLLFVTKMLPAFYLTKKALTLVDFFSCQKRRQVWTCPYFRVKLAYMTQCKAYRKSVLFFYCFIIIYLIIWYIRVCSRCYQARINHYANLKIQNNKSDLTTKNNHPLLSITVKLPTLTITHYTTSGSSWPPRHCTKQCCQIGRIPARVAAQLGGF